MKSLHSFILITVYLLSLSSSCKKNEELSNTSLAAIPTVEESQFLQPLAGCDELGRVLPAHEETGDIKGNRSVGIFYFLWQGDDASKISELSWDLSKIIFNHPEVLEDGDNENWGSRERGRFYYWGEPVYGYYRGDDYWVHLRSMQLLTDAQVDFLVIDATNALIYEEQSEALMRAILTLQQQGKNPPKMVYYTNTESGKRMQQIYDTYYRPGAPVRYPETWYYLEGKPLIIGRTNESIGEEFETFFSYRESQWPNEPMQENGWPWIDFVRPQQVYKNLKGEREIINVSVSQHPNHVAGMGGSAFYGNNDNWGRSFRKGKHGNPAVDIYYGYNFQEQWDYAQQQDVPFIFITGWNEWVAGRWGSTDDNPEHSYFCDQATPEYSRDIEPTYTAGLRDNYYMQMVANIRRYKGMNSVPVASRSKTIKMFTDWNEVKPVYIDYTKETQSRNHPGVQSNPTLQYTNNTGRNDFYLLKVARDKVNLYFYAETTLDISENKSDNWMRLYINSDRTPDTGWNGYDYRVNGGKELQKYSDGRWTTVNNVRTIQEGRKLMYSIPITGISLNSDPINLEFKWSDNMQNDDDPLDWYVNGDTAPGGRFNFVYKTK
ncbi:MAG: hypothetical protein JJE08_08990 [Proteiniphilum sp.]|nr:hypothetical protein [Proteiniphilum sp.]